MVTFDCDTHAAWVEPTCRQLEGGGSELTIPVRSGDGILLGYVRITEEGVSVTPVSAVSGS
jgi:hypothetical protein